ncbi:MAG: restriction endonuclease [Bacteroidota bacterium]
MKYTDNNFRVDEEKEKILKKVEFYNNLKGITIPESIHISALLSFVLLPVFIIYHDFPDKLFTYEIFISAITSFFSLTTIIYIFINVKYFSDRNDHKPFPEEIKIAEEYSNQKESHENLLKQRRSKEVELENKLIREQIRSISSLSDELKVHEDNLSEYKDSIQRSGITSLNHLKKMNPFEFEIYVSGIFNHLGFESVRTKSTGDQGIDIILHKDGDTYLVECKRYKETISVNHLRSFLGSLKFHNVSKGKFVTTGNFSKNCYDFEKYNIDLVDGNDLINIASKVEAHAGNYHVYSNSIKSEKNLALDKVRLFFENNSFFNEFDIDHISSLCDNLAKNAFRGNEYEARRLRSDVNSMISRFKRLKNI